MSLRLMPKAQTRLRASTHFVSLLVALVHGCGWMELPPSMLGIIDANPTQSQSKWQNDKDL